MIKESKMINYPMKSGENIQFPFYLIKGKETGPKICITAGIHGCEFTTIMVAIRLYKMLDPIEVTGQIKIIPIVNLPAFKNNTIFTCPIDDKNLNGTFPGSENGSYSEQLVFKLFNDFIKGSDYYLDLHGGDLLENVISYCMVHESGNKLVDQKSKELAEYCGSENIFVTTLNGTYPDQGYTYSHVSENGIPAVMLEIGGIGQVEEKNVVKQLEGLYNVLKFVGCLKGTFTKNKVNYFSKKYNIYSKNEGVFYFRCKLGDQVNKGDKLGILEDYLGNIIEVVKSPFSGRIAMINTSPAIQAKGVLLIIGV